MDNTLVSILIPTYNSSPLLVKMVKCIQEQTYENWELIIVDDQSTDNTVEDIKKIYINDKRIKIFVRDRLPKGSLTCRNIAFEKSKGDYIIHFDADDLISNTCIENRVKYMKENPDLDFSVFPARTFVNEEDLYNKSTFVEFGINRYTDDISSFLKVDYPFSVWNNIYKKTSIENMPWDEKILIYSDFSYIMPMLINGLKYKYQNADGYDYYYRVNYSSDNMSNKHVTAEKIESSIYLFNKTIDDLSASFNPKIFKAYLHNYRKFILFYYEKLLTPVKSEHLNIFLNFCKRKLSYHVFLKMNIIYKVVNLFSSIFLKRVSFLFLTSIFFFHKQYFMELKRILRAKIKSKLKI